MRIKVGGDLPDVDLFENGLESVNTQEMCKGKRIMIIGVVGAFYLKTYLPEFVELAEIIKSKGIDEIFCVSVNDPFVTLAWASFLNTAGKIRMLADAEGNFTRAVGLELREKASALLPVFGNLRSVRYNMIVIDGIVEKLEVEPEENGLSCTVAHYVLDKL